MTPYHTPKRWNQTASQSEDEGWTPANNNSDYNVCATCITSCRNQAENLITMYNFK